jgi:hypothetical protein
MLLLLALVARSTAAALRTAVTPCLARHAPVACSMRDALKQFLGGESNFFEEDQVVSEEVREAARSWAAMSAAIAVSGGGASDFSTNGGYPSSKAIRARLEETEQALEDLLEACAEKAPALVAEPQAVLPVAVRTALPLTRTAHA